MFINRLQLKSSLVVAIVALAFVFVACTTEKQVPVEVVKEVIKEVPVEKQVIKTVEVTKEVPVEKIVTERVEVPVEKQVIKTVEVTKEVPVEKIVTKRVEVPVEVEKIVEVEVQPTPVPTPVPGPALYQMGIFEEPITRNFWNYYGGPGGSVWTGYVLNGVAPQLYDYSDQRFDWVPSVADGFPTALTKETVDGTEFWTAEVNLKKGIKWSDGVELTADDVVFVVDTVLDLGLGSNWASAVDSNHVARVEALDKYKIKVFFNTADADGNPLTPGLAVWQFGLGFMPILPKHYWEPIVAKAKQAGDVDAQQEALFAVIPENEPTAAGFVFSRWEPGAFYENSTDPNYFRKGATVTEYDDGTFEESNAKLGYDVRYYGEASGQKQLEFEVGPHTDSELFSIYTNQDAAILALSSGEIDYVFNPLGLEKGFEDRVKATPDLDVISNPSNGVRYLGFNVRKAPMNIKEFRQAVATVIDKEFVTQTILQDAAIPVYAMVPEGNGFWHNASVPLIGKGLTRGERLEKAVALLKGAGFTYEEEPTISEDGKFVETPGKGLKMPDGTAVPALEILAPSAGYDPMRSTFAIWIERWLNDIGIPARANLTGFNVIVDTLFSDTVADDLDMWILGWGLSLFPDYLENFFNSRHAPENEGGFNWGGYSNPEFDKLSTDLLSATDLAVAKDDVNKLQAFLADDLPYVTLFTTPILDTYRPSRLEFPYTSTLGGLQDQDGLQEVVLIK